MATEPIVAQPALYLPLRRSLAIRPVVSDYWKLTKPEINFLIAISTGSAFLLGSGAGHICWIGLFNTVFATLLVASGTACLNQWMERRFDAQMRRTARRPLAAGRMAPANAFWFGTCLAFAGVFYLAVTENLPASAIALLTCLSYLLVYTPLKRFTPVCMLVGAIPGAMPPLIGWAAARGTLDSEAWLLFAIQFLWQFPHFMAIAWLYRDDYDRAGYHVLPRGSARIATVISQTMLPLAILVGLSVLPMLSGHLIHGIGAVLLSMAFLYYGAKFSWHRSAATARRLLMASIVYIPVVLVCMTLAGK